jgi:hypothetical protein
MRIRLLMPVFIVAVAAATNVAAQSQSPSILKPGLWSITVQTKTPQEGPAMTQTTCIVRDAGNRPEAPKRRPKDDCQVTTDPGGANETAYTVRCTKQKVTSTARFTYSREHYEGTVLMKLADGTEVQQSYTAVRLGDCDDVLPSAGAESVVESSNERAQ